MDLSQQKILACVKSTVPFHQSEIDEELVTQLVCNLLVKGNSDFRCEEWKQAAEKYSEGVSVAHYAQVQGLCVPSALLESLYVNRAAAHYVMSMYKRGVLDCDSALEISPGSRRALYRKALCLRELGRLWEAYECSKGCLLTAPNDQQVSDLAQELADKLGLNVHQACSSSHFVKFGKCSDDEITTNGETATNGEKPLQDFKLDLLAKPIPVRDMYGSNPAPLEPTMVPSPVFTEEVIGDELDCLLDCIPNQNPVQDAKIPNKAESLNPTPELPPAFFNSLVSQLNTLDSFTKPSPEVAPKQSLDALDTFIPELDVAEMMEGGLDSLSEFTLPGGKCTQSSIPDLHRRSTSLSNGPPSTNLSHNPLDDTHEFRQACHSCYTRIGPRVLDFQYTPNVPHCCGHNVLLCRRKGQQNGPWRRIRPCPFLDINVAFVLCREVLQKQECQYGRKCNFAYCQEEIDVWTEERKGMLRRGLLFLLDNPEKRQERVTQLLEQYTGMFLFLCEECFDRKPRFISKRSKRDLGVCSNLTACHPFDISKCLVYMVQSSNLSYYKVRQLHPLCQFSVCPHDCHLGDRCSSAHSIIELKCWELQKDTAITQEELVQASQRRRQPTEQSAQRHKPAINAYASRTPAKAASKESNNVRMKSGPCVGVMAPPAGGGQGGAEGPMRGEKGLNLKIKFVCVQCWKDGQISGPDKALKYCTAKARHSWTKEHRVLLVRSPDKNKWVAVRPLPTSHSNLQQFEICAHVVQQRKCHYIGNCSFAHNVEEKDVWTYMKNNSLKDVEQMYDMWLTNQGHHLDGNAQIHPLDEKPISMPTDFAELMSGFYCRLCGRHSNSERQWEQHISSEKHKDRVFSCEGEDEGLAWKHRFPGQQFALCSRLGSSCPDGVSCDYAHSEEELAEWEQRRDFLRRKLAKAREDLLIAPNECKFGKYNFLLRD